MPFIDIKVIQGVFTPEEKRELVESVSEAVIAVEGEALRPVHDRRTHRDAKRGVGGRWTDLHRGRRQGNAIGRRGRVANRLGPQRPLRP